MVDFSNESMISKPPIDIINLIVIEHWYNWRLAWEFYLKHRTGGNVIPTSECRSRLCSLFLSIIGLLKRRLPPEKYTEVYNICCDLSKRPTDQELLITYLDICTVLDECNLIKIDTKPFVNRRKIEESNKAEGY